MLYKNCETCEWFWPASVNGWEGDRYRRKVALARWLFEKGTPLEGWPGSCNRKPKTEDVKSSYGCSHWKADDDLVSDFSELNRRFYAANDVAELKQKLKEERARSRKSLDALRDLRKKLKSKD